MSIHDMVDVKEGETHETNYTRDRFGRTHRLANEDGSKRIQILRHMVLAGFFVSSLLAGSFATASPNTKVSSDDMSSFWGIGFNEEKEEPFNFLKNGDTALGFNEDGDPSLSTRF